MTKIELLTKLVSDYFSDCLTGVAERSGQWEAKTLSVAAVTEGADTEGNVNGMVPNLDTASAQTLRDFRNWKDAKRMLKRERDLASA